MISLSERDFLREAISSFREVISSSKNKQILLIKKQCPKIK
jgi:hypothetical protein